MNVVTTVKEVRELVTQKKQAGLSIGFVPTMGYLHEGHLTLVQQAKAEKDIVVMSIFVNPLQFGPNEDFDSYPRDFNRDERLAREAGVDILFYPAVNEMYPNEPTISFSVDKRVNVLCGRKREGHFDGVVTVVSKLFNIIQPNAAYFGLKDAQQVAVIQGMVEDLAFPVEIKPVDTVREADGLAKSSRNVRLSKEERAEAPVIYRALQEVKTSIQNGEITSVAEATERFEKTLSSETTGVIDYIELYSFPALQQLDVLKGKIIIAAAVQYEHARLIDNVIFTVEENVSCIER